MKLIPIHAPFIPGGEDSDWPGKFLSYVNLTNREFMRLSEDLNKKGFILTLIQEDEQYYEIKKKEVKHG